MRNQHPDYLSWGRQRRKWIWLVLGSGVALVLMDALFLSSLHQILPYAIPVYLLATVYLLIIQQVRKVREFRDSWSETHPFPSPPVSPEAESDPSMTKEHLPLPRWQRKDWKKAVFWIALVALSAYLLILLASAGYTAPP